MKKRFFALVLASLMAFSLMSTAAFAVGAEDTEKEVYTLTVDAEVVSTYATTSDSTQTASSSMGLALDPGASGTSNIVNVRFSTLPSNAVVQSVKIVPGTATINSGNPNMLGSVVPSLLKVTSPDGRSASINWSNTMTTSTFTGQPARGTWTMCFNGTNIMKPSGNPMDDLLRVGSTSFKSAKVTITYTLE